MVTRTNHLRGSEGDLQSATEGFTLVELLVVLGIIAILASMLLPALAAAKERAREAACINNIRQLSTGLRMYWDDNAETSPAASDFGDLRPENWIWPQTWAWWNRGSPNHRRDADLVLGALGPYAAMTRPLLRCPSDRTLDRFLSHPELFPQASVNPWWFPKRGTPLLYPFNYTLSHDGVDCPS